MGQKFKQTFYKKIKLGKYTNVYLFKTYESWDGKPSKLVYMSAYRDRKTKDFIVESGAGISTKRMESQIKKYLESRMKSKGYI